MLSLIEPGVTSDDEAEPVALEDIADPQANTPIEALRIGVDDDLSAIAALLPRVETAYVDFGAFTDGRGFSIARILRQQHAFTGRLIADGTLIPDQFAFALQCGFDAVRIDPALLARHSEADWQDNLSDFGLTYQRGYAVPQGPGTSVFDARATSDHQEGPETDAARDPFFGLSAEDILRRTVERYPGDVFLATSMGADSAVLLHMVSRIAPDLPVYFLETGKHFEETLAYRDQLVSALGLTNFINVYPDPEQLRDIDPTGELNATDPDVCCAVRKVEPLKHAVSHYGTQVTGRKRYQTPERADMAALEIRDGQDKVNPLAYWTAKDVTAYIRRHNLPPHPLLAKGFPSIGCAPCTTKVKPGEDPRAGRWRGKGKTECGIHMVDGKWQAVKSEKRTFEAF